MYPSTLEGLDVEGRAGLEVADPYRWLEASGPAVAEWQRLQNQLASQHVDQIPQLASMTDRVERLYVGRPPVVPRFVAGVWWRIEGQRAVVRADATFGDGTLVIDVQLLAPDNDAAILSWISPSPDGSVLAVGVCQDGSERNVIVLVDPLTGRLLPSPSQVLFDAWSGGAVWLPDSSGYLFIAMAPDDDPRWMTVHRHLLAEAPPTSPEPVAHGLDAFRDYLHVAVSGEGRWAVLSRRLAAPIPFAISDLTRPETGWRPFVSRDDCGLTGYVIGDSYVAVTDLDAPRGRLVSVPLCAADPNDAASWTELVPQSDAVLRTVTPVADHLYLTEMVDTYSQVRIVDRSGRYIGHVPLPGRGALSEPHFPLLTLVPRGHPDALVFSFSTLTRSWGSYLHRPGNAALVELAPPQVELEGATVLDRFARSSDGALVPYHLVLPAQSPTGPLPALVWGYGGFNIPNVPQFPGAMAAVVAAGGIFVHAHLRGGAEYGRDWWHAGRGLRKQQTFDDLYAIAEDLIAHGDTTAAQLALTGGSNGGLLCGVAATQRPELFRAIVPQVPILDLIGALRDPYGEATVREYADPDDADDLQRLLTFSPYHLAEQEAVYPALFVMAGDTDPRCPPWHARKWVARMQAAQRGDDPVLLRVWESVGHGLATPPETVRRQAAEWLAFVADKIGLA